MHDPLAPWNDNTFLVRWKDEETICEIAEEGPYPNLIELDIQTLTAMLMGYKRPTYLYENERLKMEYYLVDVLEKLISNDKPYFSDYF